MLTANDNYIENILRRFLILSGNNSYNIADNLNENRMKENFFEKSCNKKMKISFSV